MFEEADSTKFISLKQIPFDLSVKKPKQKQKQKNKTKKQQQQQQQPNNTLTTLTN